MSVPPFVVGRSRGRLLTTNGPPPNRQARRGTAPPTPVAPAPGAAGFGSRDGAISSATSGASAATPARMIGSRPGRIASRIARSLVDRGRPIRIATRVPSSVSVRSYVRHDLGRARDGHLPAEREVIERPPVEDLLDDRVLAVDAVVGRADAAAAAGGLLDDLRHARPASAAGGRATSGIPGDRGRRRQRRNRS